MNIFNSDDYEHTITGRTRMSGTLWIGFSAKNDYDLDNDSGGDVIIEFEKDEHARDFIELLEKELKGDDE